MTILDFIETQYPIKDRIQNKLSDPYRRIAESDDFPYDKIGPDEDGIPTKLIEIDDCTYIPVMELISMTKEEVEQKNDPVFKEIWEEYMKDIDVQAVNVIDIMECVRTYREMRARKEEQASVLSVQKE